MKKAAVICLIAGVVMALLAGGWTIYNEYDEMRAAKEADQALGGLIAAIGAQGVNAAFADKAAADNPVLTQAQHADLAALEADAAAQVEREDGFPEMPTVTVDGHTYIGYLLIPDISLELPIQKGWDMDLLTRSPAGYHGSIPEGNLIIAGHNYKQHFAPLKKMAVGGRVVFVDVKGREYDYVVSEVLTVGGYETQRMLSGDEDWDLTLFTCTVGGKSRVTLRCTLVGERDSAMDELKF